MIISDQIINNLIEAGKLDDADEQLISVLHPLKSHQLINCGRSKQWAAIAQELSILDLIHLNKGLTRVEYFHNWSGGSFAAVIWTFRIVESRCPEKADELADWILQRTKNPYLPYGFDNLGATSFLHYSILKQAKSENYENHLKRQKKKKELAAIRRAEEKKQRSKAVADRSTKIRELFLSELSKKTLDEQLWQLANDRKYPVTFYPTCLARISQEKLAALDEGLRKALQNKLKIKCRGPWAKFKRRLKATCM